MSERETQGGGQLGRCHICDRTFPTQEELSQHLMDEHEEGETLGDPLDAPDPSALEADDGGGNR